MNGTQEATEGRYLYCIASCGDGLSLGEIGVDKAKVYTIPHNDIVAVVHACPAKPYESKDESRVKRWVFTHNYVIDQATKRFGTVLPFSFDSIVNGDDSVVQGWLGENYQRFNGEIERLRGKSEYTVQIFCDASLLARRVENDNQEIGKLVGEIKVASKGKAHLLERKLEKMVREAVAVEVRDLSKKFREQIEKHVEEAKDEQSKFVPELFKDKRLVLGLSCLVGEGEVEKLGEALRQINERDGFSVRFTGPWAPFSFVRLRK